MLCSIVVRGKRVRNLPVLVRWNLDDTIEIGFVLGSMRVAKTDRNAVAVADLGSGKITGLAEWLVHGRVFRNRRRPSWPRDARPGVLDRRRGMSTSGWYTTATRLRRGAGGGVGMISNAFRRPSMRNAFS